jgi:chemotaxis protein methyltransferase CheR
MNAFESLQEEITARYGLVVRSEWNRHVKRAAIEMARYYGCTPQELVGLIKNDEKAMMAFASFFTVGETYFLRHPEQFKFLVEYFNQRSLLNERQNSFLIWSAGCSTGEEPYSSAIVLRENSYGITDGKVKIIASDMNDKAIAIAQKGIFQAWSFRNVPPWFLARYFTPLDDGGCKLNDEIRGLVEFKCVSIQEQLKLLAPNSVDVVFFRNVAIYLNRNVLDQIYLGFIRILKDGGCVIVAPADPRPPLGPFELYDDRSTCIYQFHEESSVKRQPSVVTVRDTKPVEKRPKKRRFRKAEYTRPLSFSRQNRTAEESSCRRQEGMNNALKLSDRGDVTRALEITNQIIDMDSGSKDGYLLRGQIHLANMSIDKAIMDFRRVVFIDSSDKIARFWYALALQKNGAQSKALNQLDELTEQLASVSIDTLLEDGETTAGELLRNVRQMKESIR